MAEQITEYRMAQVGHEANEKRLKDMLHEVQQRLQRLEHDVSREMRATIDGLPHCQDIVELATYGITHEVVQGLANLHLDSLADKAAQFAVSRERLERLEVERLRKEEA